MLIFSIQTYRTKKFTKPRIMTSKTSEVRFKGHLTLVWLSAKHLQGQVHLDGVEKNNRLTTDLFKGLSTI